MTPQPPQFAPLLVKSTQAPLHSAWPTGQPQKPLMHGVPAPQAVPQAPQLAAFDLRSTQAPLHALCPVGQAFRTQPPATQD
jgi:hypothetical protein